MFGEAPITPAQLLRELVEGLRRHNGGETWSSGENEVWTGAVKSTLKAIGTRHSRTTQCFYTKAEPDMQEFLLDLVWWNKEGVEGASLACECEWQYAPMTGSQSYATNVGSDFGKLLVFKAPLKLMIFASSKQSPEIEALVVTEINRNLDSYKHHVVGETYLVLDFAPQPKAWIAKIDQNGASHPQLAEFKF
jgi:hypothetical protein